MHTRVNILGVKISAINMQRALAAIQEWINNKDPNYICVTPAHSVMDCRDDPELLQIFNRSGLTTPDGMSIVWLLKLRGYKHVKRVYGADLMMAVCEQGLKHGWRHYFYGGAPGIAELLITNLQTSIPELQVAGQYSPPFRPLSTQEDQAIIEMIRTSKPDILWVGISTPKQEKWMGAHIHKLDVPVLAGVGAAFDFLSGNKKQAPQWVQRSGLEWLFRLFSEPKRLWRRYIRYPFFALLAISQLLGLKSYED